MPRRRMDFEESLEQHLKPFGTWQRLLLLGASLTYLPAILYLPTFPNMVPSYRCKIPGETFQTE